MQTVHSSRHFKIKLKPQIYTIFAKFVLQNLQKIKLYFIALFSFFLYMLEKFITYHINSQVINMVKLAIIYKYMLFTYTSKY